ncbi:MAG: hypothetical protein ACRC6M_10130, partial [Microcystaceae cyanobacterium]
RELRYFTADEMLVPTPKEAALQEKELVLQEKERADLEKQRADLEKQKVDQLVAQLRSLGVEPQF